MYSYSPIGPRPGRPPTQRSARKPCADAHLRRRHDSQPRAPIVSSSRSTCWSASKPSASGARRCSAWCSGAWAPRTCSVANTSWRMTPPARCGIPTTFPVHSWSLTSWRYSRRNTSRLFRLPGPEDAGVRPAVMRHLRVPIAEWTHERNTCATGDMLLAELQWWVVRGDSEAAAVGGPNGRCSYHRCTTLGPRRACCCHATGGTASSSRSPWSISASRTTSRWMELAPADSGGLHHGESNRRAWRRRRVLLIRRIWRSRSGSAIWLSWKREDENWETLVRLLGEEFFFSVCTVCCTLFPMLRIFSSLVPWRLLWTEIYPWAFFEVFAGCMLSFLWPIRF